MFYSFRAICLFASLTTAFGLTGCLNGGGAGPQGMQASPMRPFPPNSPATITPPLAVPGGDTSFVPRGPSPGSPVASPNIQPDFTLTPAARYPLGPTYRRGPLRQGAVFSPGPMIGGWSPRNQALLTSNASVITTGPFVPVGTPLLAPGTIVSNSSVSNSAIAGLDWSKSPVSAARSPGSTPPGSTPPGSTPPSAMQLADNSRTVDGRPVPLFDGSDKPEGFRRPDGSKKSRHMKSTVKPGSKAEEKHRERAGRIGQAPSKEALAKGFRSTPNEDLRYRGGHTIRDLKYLNIYVGGNNKWPASERQLINYYLEKVMLDPHLNHVLMQYFNDQPISAEYLGSYNLDAYNPKQVSQSEIESVVKALYSKGQFKNLDYPSTVINFMLPKEVVLLDPGGAQAEYAHRIHQEIPFEDEASSKEGLGGYHGSVHTGGNTIYYSICVYSERRPDGYQNGIPAFNQPWKNIVATFYHELQEARTDADVDDAIQTGQEHYLGWTSDRGEEVGDFPVSESDSTVSAFQEVPLADGSGNAPVQLCYSNAVHGPEGPIPMPHKGRPLTQPKSKAPYPGSPTTPTPPPVTEPHDLNWLNKEWNLIPEPVRARILKLVEESIPPGN